MRGFTEPHWVMSDDTENFKRLQIAKSGDYRR
jgi:hypothetical protein